MPVDNSIIATIEAEEGHIAAKLLFPGMPAIPGSSIFIGSDHIWKLATNYVKRCKDIPSFVAINTLLAWTFQRPINSNWSVSVASNACVLRTGTGQQDEVNALLRNFWELDAIGIKEECSTQKKRGKAVQDHFERNIAWSGGRSQVSQPWRESADDLNDSLALAGRWLENLSRRSGRNK